MTEFPFSAFDRQMHLDIAGEKYFDLLIIGGGITGAGIALDAASRGLSVVLVEKKDFAWGTSSRSTKLIHGGLRYLKQFEIGLVREVGKERAIVHKNARHIVVPEKMLLPIVEGGSLGKKMSSLGLWVYDKLAGVEREEQRRMLTREETLELEPLLNKEGLISGGLYFEYRTDDARLTIEVIKSAVSHGALCIHYAEVVDFLYSDERKLSGAIVKDNFSGKTYTVQTRKTVNAAGPWVDKLRKLDQESIIGKRLHLTKGVHIVLPWPRLPLKQAVYFDVKEDQRMVFAIPRGMVTYIGTTDTDYFDKIEEPFATKSDVTYVLRAANEMFPGLHLKIDDVISSWAGLRPLIHEDGKDPSELSRKDEIFHASSGLVSIAGGKLTGYRKMAQKVTDLVVNELIEEELLNEKMRKCKTKKIRLSGADFDSDEQVEELIDSLSLKLKGKFNASIIKSLVFKYGKSVSTIFEKTEEICLEKKDHLHCLLQAEIWYGIHFEMCSSLNDFLIRRTGRLYFERPEVAKIYVQVAEEMAKQLLWSDQRKKAELDDFKVEFESVVKFRKE